MDKQCVSCSMANEDDCLTCDGLCFDCDVEKIKLVVEHNNLDGIIEKLAIAQGLEPGNEKASN